MIRRFLTAVLVVAALAAASPASALADAPGRSSCVTKAEEAKVPGMSRREVREVLGWEGYANAYRPNARDFRPCGFSWDKGRVIVRFDNHGRVTYPIRVTMRAGTLDLPPALVG